MVKELLMCSHVGFSWKFGTKLWFSQVKEMALFGLIVGINYGHIPCSCVCVLQLYTGLDIFNLINQ